MIDDEWARTLLADPDIGNEPPSKVDPRLAAWKGRRRLRRRRTTIAVTVAGLAVLAITGVPLLASTPPNRTGPPRVAESLTSPAESAPTESAPTESAPTFVSAPTSCRREKLDLPPRATGGHMLGGDPSGRYGIGLVYIDDVQVPVLWDGKRAVVLGEPGPGHLIGMAVNSSGVVVLAMQADGGGKLSWIHRDGRFTQLGGSGYSAVAINARGDVAGAWLDDAGVHPPAIWPAGQTGEPRVLEGGDPGDGHAVAVGGIDDDGTVVGTATPFGRYSGDRSSPPPQPSSRPLYWPAINGNGSAGNGAARELPMPAGFSTTGWVFGIRSGMATGNVARIDPDRDRRGNRAVIWDLAAGTVTVDDRLGSADDITAQGWVVGRSSETVPAGYVPPPVAVFAGNVVRLPLPSDPKPDSGGGISISDDGRVIYGSAFDTGGLHPMRWLCD